MIATLRRARARRRAGDRGAALVEAALVTPVFFLLMFGIFEFGLMFRDLQTTADAAGNGARKGAVVGPRPGPNGHYADYEIVKVIRESFGATPIEWIERIVIFEALPPGAGGAVGQVPQACRIADGTGANCNVYNAQAAFLAVETGDFDHFLCPGTGPTCGWPPGERSNGPSSLEIDYLGVYIRLERPYVTGIFGSTFTIEQAEIVRLEPGQLQ
jgi:hypothetical protein